MSDTSLFCFILIFIIVIISIVFGGIGAIKLIILSFIVVVAITCIIYYGYNSTTGFKTPFNYYTFIGTTIVIVIIFITLATIIIKKSNLFSK